MLELILIIYYGSHPFDPDAENPNPIPDPDSDLPVQRYEAEVENGSCRAHHVRA